MGSSRGIHTCVIIIHPDYLCLAVSPVLATSALVSFVSLATNMKNNQLITTRPYYATLGYRRETWTACMRTSLFPGCPLMPPPPPCYLVPVCFASFSCLLLSSPLLSSLLLSILLYLLDDNCTGRQPPLPRAPQISVGEDVGPRQRRAAGRRCRRQRWWRRCNRRDLLALRLLFPGRGAAK